MLLLPRDCCQLCCVSLLLRCVQCIVKDDPDSGKRVVAGTHWDFDSYGGTIKKQLGMPTQVSSATHTLKAVAVTHPQQSLLQMSLSPCVLQLSHKTKR